MKTIIKIASFLLVCLTISSCWKINFNMSDEIDSVDVAISFKDAETNERIRNAQVEVFEGSVFGSAYGPKIHLSFDSIPDDTLRFTLNKGKDIFFGGYTIHVKPKGYNRPVSIKVNFDRNLELHYALETPKRQPVLVSNYTTDSIAIWFRSGTYPKDYENCCSDYEIYLGRGHDTLVPGATITLDLPVFSQDYLYCTRSNLRFTNMMESKVLASGFPNDTIKFEYK